jgi:GNAT superfamily N-acetyltransferase/protein-S-isoprenylcysteine O-methyltransferase Ste14
MFALFVRFALLFGLIWTSLWAIWILDGCRLLIQPQKWFGLSELPTNDTRATILIEQPLVLIVPIISLICFGLFHTFFAPRRRNWGKGYALVYWIVSAQLLWFTAWITQVSVPNIVVWDPFNLFQAEYTSISRWIAVIVSMIWFLPFPLIIRQLRLVSVFSEDNATAKLIDDRWFALVRHPLYLLLVCSLLVTPLMTLRRFLTVIGVISYLWSFGISIEEDELERRFGITAIRSYRSRVPALFPSLSSIAQFISDMKKENKKSNRSIKKGVSIRRGTPADVALVLHLIKELAAYEKLSHMVVATETGLHECLFGDFEGRGAACEVLIADYDGQSVGFALFFHNFSTFMGRPGIYLEDLFVLPEYRGRGLGFALLRHLAQLAIERNCKRMEWACLNWNEPSIRFYKSLGATPMTDWTIFRLSTTDGSLQKLASSSID